MLGSAFAPRLIRMHVHVHTQCATPGTPEQAEKNLYGVYLMSSLYVYIIFKKSSANSTHLNKKAPPWAFPPLLLLAGALQAAGAGRCCPQAPGTAPALGRGRRLDRTIPKCFALHHLAQLRLGCRLGT